MAINAKHLKDKTDAECRALAASYYIRARKAENDAKVVRFERDVANEKLRVLFAAIEDAQS